MKNCPLCLRYIGDGSHGACVDRLWTTLERLARTESGDTMNLLRVIREMNEPATADQQLEIAELELSFLGLKQMGLPREMTQAQAAAYVDVLRWKRIPYEERV